MKTSSRLGWRLPLAAVVAALFFFPALQRLWPLAELELNVDRHTIHSAGIAALGQEGFDVAGASWATALAVDDPTLDYMERTFGRDRTQEWIRNGLPIYMHRVWFRTAGDPDTTAASFHPAQGIIAWTRTTQDDAPGASIPTEAAGVIARAALDRWVARDSSGWEPSGYMERERPARRDHVFIWERWISESPELRERATITITGDRLTRVEREVVLPESGRRDARARQANVVALQMVSFVLIAFAVVAAFVVFLTRLRAGSARLLPAALWIAFIAVCFIVTQAMRRAEMLLAWDPLWPRWIAELQSLGMNIAEGAWVLLVLFIVIAAGDAVDRENGFGRGASLWALSRGRFFDRSVGLASLRGFCVGLICGAVLTGAMYLLEHFAGAWVAIQPRGFFFMALNSAAPTLATLLYFLMVALVEELSYRYFAGSILLAKWNRRWLAILLPAVLYGASHTGLPFIPPVEPFWGRAIVFTAIGAVWGWAFLRYDALTVVLSHWAADLFIFNWPRLASGDPVLVTKSVLAIATPLVPALLWGASVLKRRP